MEPQSLSVLPPNPGVKATFRLASETYTIGANKGLLSEQLISTKEESMAILKDYITRHNVPNDVPDELLEEEDDEVKEKPPVKPKKTKLT